MRYPILNLKDYSERIVAAPVEIKLAGDNTGSVTGHGSVFGVRDAHGDIVAKGAFTDTIRQHKTNGTRPLMLWSHDPERIIGVWDTFSEDERGLKLTGRLNLDTQAGKEAHSLLKQGALSGLSIGYRVAPGGATFDAKTGIRHLKRLDLFEVSIVGFPSNGHARIDGVKMERRSDFELFLEDAGFPNGAARKLSAGGWPALSGHEEDAERAAADLLTSIKNATLELRGQGGR